ncbi:two-component regulator propeller domain-containing protein [Ancylomarina sp. YFZ004]
MRKVICLSLIFCFVVSSVFAEIKSVGIPFIRSFSKREYKGGSQNWNMVQTSNGLMYFANNDGVLEFDGNSWRLIPMPNSSVVRSLAVDSLQRIYVGAYNELGYLEPDQQGKLSYHTLIDLIPEAERDFSEIWQIFPYEDGILFHSFQKILYYKGGKITVFNSQTEFHYSFMLGNQLFIQEKEKGLCLWNNQKAEQVSGGGFFKDLEIVSILPYSDHSMIIATATSGLFLFDGDKVEVWDASLNEIFKKDRLFSGISLGDRFYAFGSVVNGIYILDKSGQLVQHINSDKGLQNNTILCLFQDQEENLWLGLDNGIDYLEISSPLSLLKTDRDIGTGYTSIVHDNYLYLGTNMGLFCKALHNESNLSLETDDLELVKNTTGQVWSLQVVDGELICGHNKGTFRIEKNQANLISDIEGGWKYLYKEEFPNQMICGTYSGLILFEKTAKSNWKWQFVKEIGGFNESSREMIWDDDYSIWMCHGYKGVYHIFLNPSLDSCVSYRFYDENDGFNSRLNINVQKIRDEIVFSSPNGFYKYQPELDRFGEHKYLNDLLGPKGWVSKLIEDDNGDVWFFQGGNLGLLKRQIGNSYEMIRKPFVSLKDAFTNAFENTYTYDRENVLIGTEQGFVHYNPSITKRYDSDFQVLIREVSLTSSRDSVIFFGEANQAGLTADDMSVSLPYSNNALRFIFSAPQYSDPDLVHYHYQLIGFEDAPSICGSTLQKEYTNLPEGDYIFRLDAQNQYGIKAQSAEFYFSIAPPWYRSIIAYILYVLVCIFILLLAVYLIRRRMRTVQMRLKQRQDEELKAKEQKFREEALLVEKEIVQLRNEKLKNEVVFKNRELASSTMNIIHKNEVLSYALGELKKALKKIQDPTALVQVKKLAKTVEKEFNSEEDWEQFELNFDQVHANYLQKLRKEYPQLSPKDLRMCAYLRMNLSTKEIAPLMNISVRGVEISRYRLRKKFELHRDDNLIEFLLNI